MMLRMFPPALLGSARTSRRSRVTTCGIQYRGAGWNAIAPLAGAYASLLRCNIGRHCERSEAIQKASADTVLDCFVASLLAMTKNRPPAAAVDTVSRWRFMTILLSAPR